MTSPVDKAINHFGGITALQKMLGVSYVAIRKWQEKGYFPRTDYTGETKYAETLAEASGGQLIASDLLPPYQNKTPDA